MTAYLKLLRAIPIEVGEVFDDSRENMDALAEAMNCRPRRVYTDLLALERLGLIAASYNGVRLQRRWRITAQGKAA